MEFFNQLLTSYSLLKKRKLHITLDEESTESKINYANLSELAQSGNKLASDTINNVANVIQGTFAGVDIEGQGTVTNVNPASAKEAGIELYQVNDPDSACGGYVQYNNQILVSKDCIVNQNIFKSFRQALINYFYGAGSEQLAGEQGLEPTNPTLNTFLNTVNGAALIDKYKDNPKVLRDLMGIYEWVEYLSDPNGLSLDFGDFGDIEKKRSLFGVIGETTKAVRAEASKLGSLGGVSFESSIADTTQIEGSVNTLYTFLRGISKSKTDPKDITVDQADWMKDNVKILIPEKGKPRIFFNSGFDDLGVQFDGGKHAELINVISGWNDLLESKGDEFSDKKIDSIDRQTILDKSEITSTKCITDISEEIDTLVLLLSLGKNKSATKLYEKLNDQYGKNINKVLRISEMSKEYAATEDAEAWIQSLSNSKEEYGEDLPSFVQKLTSLRGKAIKESGAIGCIRVGTGGGKEGFKSDQIMLFDDKDKAKKYQGTGLISSTLYEAVTSNIKNKNKAWEEYKDRWGVTDGDKDKEVYLGYDSLKYTTGSSYAAGSRPGYATTVTTTVSELGKKSKFISDISKMSGAKTPEQKASLRETFVELDTNMQRFDTFMGSASTGSLTKESVRREFLESFKPSLESMGFSEKDIQSFTDKSANTYQLNKLESVKESLKELYFIKRIQQGIDAGEEKWAHVAAFNIVRSTYDINDANDIVVNPQQDTVQKKKRNKAIKSSVDKFLQDPQGGFKPSGTGYRIGLFGMTQDKKRNSSTVTYSYKKSTQNEEVTPSEIMNKLLEVQQLIYSNLIKE